MVLELKYNITSRNFNETLTIFIRFKFMKQYLGSNFKISRAFSSKVFVVFIMQSSCVETNTRPPVIYAFATRAAVEAPIRHCTLFKF